LHQPVVLANGPIERRTGVVSIGVKRVTREERQTTISRAVARASAEAESDDVVAICLDAEETVWPYSVIAHTLVTTAE
jgi:hypothetical protein